LETFQADGVERCEGLERCALANMVTKPTGHQGGPNPPGYKAPVLDGKRLITAYVPRDLFDAITKRVQKDGTSKQEAITRLLTDYAKHDGQK
jgi:hypothetical protein